MSARGQPTVDAPASSDRDTGAAPAAIAVFVESRPVFRPVPFDRGRATLGRLADPDVPEDNQSSRKHAELVVDGTTLHVHDLGSRNGTYVDGQRIARELKVQLPCVVRIGATVFLVVSDVRSMRAGVTAEERGVVGPVLGAALDRVAQAARSRDILLVTGETGTGKERAARMFHDRGAASAGPFLAVNCATIPQGVAERLLFGTLKGAYSGADAVAEGYIAAAHGGTLFLDEIGELDPVVQPKLLRVLETREILQLGSASPRRVTTRFCFATMRKLRTAVQQGTFRADLFYRIGREEIELPPLRERREEIPWLLERAIKSVAADAVASAQLVETCMLLPWPGNVRELLAAGERAATTALQHGKTSVRETHLDPDAGRVEPASRPSRAPTRDAIEVAITEHDGNLAAVARHFGLHRSQLYRLLKQLGIRE